MEIHNMFESNGYCNNVRRSFYYERLSLYVISTDMIDVLDIINFSIECFKLTLFLACLKAKDISKISLSKTVNLIKLIKYILSTT